MKKEFSSETLRLKDVNGDDPTKKKSFETHPNIKILFEVGLNKFGFKLCHSFSH